MANLFRSVPNPTLSGDATAADVKSGKTFYGSSYTKQTGSYVEPTIHGITPQNDSAPSLTSGSVYQPSTDGYAIKSFNNVTPRNSSPYSVQVGDMAHIETNNGYVVATEPIPITPASTSPPPIETNKLYLANDDGYAIQSYSEVNLTTYGQQVRIGGGMIKVNINTEEMSSAYVVGGSPGMKETTLWTNSSPTSNFSDNTTVNLSSAISNYDYIGIDWKGEKAASTSTARNIWSVADIKKSNRTNKPSVVLLLGGYTISSGGHYLRPFSYVSDTQLNFGNANRYDNSSNPTQERIIPIKIVGLKL